METCYTAIRAYYEQARREGNPMPTHIDFVRYLVDKYGFVDQKDLHTIDQFYSEIFLTFNM